MMGTYHALRGFNRRLQALFVVTLVFRMGTMAFPFYAAYLIHQHAVSASIAGLLVGTYGVGALFVDLIVGALIKRFSSGRVILGSLLTNALLLLIIPSIDSIAALFVLSFLWGLLRGLHSGDLLGDGQAQRPANPQGGVFLQPPGDQYRHGHRSTAGQPGVPQFGQRGVLHQCRAIAVVVRRLPALCRPRLHAGRGHGGEPGRGNGLPDSVPFERSRLLVILLTSLPVHIAYALPPTFLSAYIINYTDLPTYFVGIIFFINALLVILFEVPINQRMSHLSSSYSLVAGFVLAGIGFFLMGFSEIGWLLLLATVLWSLGR